MTATALNWIDGVWVDSDKHNDSFNPASGEKIGIYADGEREARAAVAAAKRAFHETRWKRIACCALRLCTK
jgi:betaine-aldehyde dehydrogenase